MDKGDEKFPWEDDPLKRPLKEEDGSKSSVDKAKMLVRLVAGGFYLIGFMYLAAYWIKSQHEQTGISVVHCLVLAIPLVIGTVILVKTTAIAERIDEWLEQ